MSSETRQFRNKHTLAYLHYAICWEDRTDFRLYVVELSSSTLFSRWCRCQCVGKNHTLGSGLPLSTVYCLLEIFSSRASCVGGFIPLLILIISLEDCVFAVRWLCVVPMWNIGKIVVNLNLVSHTKEQHVFHIGIEKWKRLDWRADASLSNKQYFSNRWTYKRPMWEINHMFRKILAWNCRSSSFLESSSASRAMPFGSMTYTN